MALGVKPRGARRRRCGGGREEIARGAGTEEATGAEKGETEPSESLNRPFSRASWSSELDKIGDGERREGSAGTFRGLFDGTGTGTGSLCPYLYSEGWGFSAAVSWSETGEEEAERSGAKSESSLKKSAKSSIVFVEITECPCSRRSRIFGQERRL